jgi:hypothetical protein
MDLVYMPIQQQRYIRVADKATNQPVQFYFDACTAISHIVSSSETNKKQCMFWVHGEKALSEISQWETTVREKFPEFTSPVVERDEEKFLLLVKFPFRYSKFETEFTNSDHICGVPVSSNVQIDTHAALGIEMGYMYNATSKSSGNSYKTTCLHVKSCRFL